MLASKLTVPDLGVVRSVSEVLVLLAVQAALDAVPSCPARVTVNTRSACPASPSRTHASLIEMLVSSFRMPISRLLADDWIWPWLAPVRLTVKFSLYSAKVSAATCTVTVLVKTPLAKGSEPEGSAPPVKSLAVAWWLPLPTMLHCTEAAPA